MRNVFVWLYLLSFTVLAGWFVLLLIGFFDAGVLKFANAILIPTLPGAIVCAALFKYLAIRAERKSEVSNG